MNKKQTQLRKAKEARAGETAPPVVQGGKYLRLVERRLEALHGAGTERDRAGKRQLFYDQ